MAPVLILNPFSMLLSSEVEFESGVQEAFFPESRKVRTGDIDIRKGSIPKIQRNTEYEGTRCQLLLPWHHSSANTPLCEAQAYLRSPG